MTLHQKITIKGLVAKRLFVIGPLVKRNDQNLCDNMAIIYGGRWHNKLGKLT